MAKLTKSEKIKVGVAIALIVLIIGCAFGVSITPRGLSLFQVNLGGWGDGDTWGGSWQTVGTWKESADGISVIEAQADAADIVLKRGAGEQVVVHEQAMLRGGAKKPATTTDATVSDGTLTVREQGLGVINGGSRRIVIEVPSALEGTLKTVGLSASAGDVVADGIAVGAVALDSSAGDVSVRDVDADSLAASSSAGDISATFARQLPRALSLAAGAGDIEFTAPRKSGFTLDLSQGAGDFDHDDVELGTEGGSLYRYGDGSAKVTLQTSAGDVELAVR